MNPPYIDKIYDKILNYIEHTKSQILLLLC